MRAAPRNGLSEAWTIFILIEAAEAHQAFDIGSLLSSLPGAKGPKGLHGHSEHCSLMGLRCGAQGPELSDE